MTKQSSDPSHARQLLFGDFLELAETIPDRSVDLILADPPYGTTQCEWDKVIPFAAMWTCINRIKTNPAAVVLFGNQPFTARLICSNEKDFKYEIIWEKTNAKGFLSSKFRPLTSHENIMIFGKAKTYNPQKWVMPEHLRTKRKTATRKNTGAVYGNGEITRYEDTGIRNPSSVIGFSNRAAKEGNFHPTQKPIALIEYLIKTYSNPGDTVLDFCMGGGTTGIAALKNSRKFIGIENDPTFFKTATDRIQNALFQPELEL